MAKRNSNGATAFMLTFFVFLFPIFMSGFDKKAVVYASLSLSLLFLAYEIVKERKIVVAKFGLLMLLFSIYSYASLFYISDKGNHGALSAFFLFCSVMAMLGAYMKQSLGEDLFKKIATEVLYKGATLFSVCVLLWQIFIDSSFLSNMDLGGGTSTASGIFLLAGIFSAVKLCRDGKRNVGLFVSMALMIYSFIMARSLLCYLILAIVCLITALNMRHRKVEALIALVISVILGVINLIYMVAMFVTGKVEYSGAIEGLLKIVGIGSGGYMAKMGVFDIQSKSAPNTFLFLTECFGIVGVVVVLIVLALSFILMARKRSFADMFFFFVILAVVLSNVYTLGILFPLACIYLGAKKPFATVNLSSIFGYILVLPTLFFFAMFFSRIFFTLGDSAYEIGKWQKAEEYYSLSANMSLFDSEGWEKAYNCASQGATEEEKNIQAQREYLEKARSFNKENYRYQKLLADVYTKDNNFEMALQIWEDIMAKHENEYLYEGYCQKIMDVMANSTDSVRVEELYGRIKEYADKALDKDVKYNVNNILAKSQVYYIDIRENGDALGDMYQDSAIGIVEEMTEYESSSSES